MMPFRLSRRHLLAAAPLLAVPLGGGAAAAAEADFAGFIAGLRRDALAQGIRSTTIDGAWRYVQYLPDVIDQDRKQPEHVRTFSENIERSVTAQRKEEVRRRVAENWALLERVQQRFGVEPPFVVALWGIESAFGTFMGTYSVVAALATLAYDGRRGAYFRAEAMAALRILDQGHIGPGQMLGSWAGAMGQCQFMPSTFLGYAVDFDGDGRRDIWTDRADALGSIANYLGRLGWRRDEGWGRDVRVPPAFDARLAGIDTARPLSEWTRLGVRGLDGGKLSGRNLDASLLLPDGPGGPALLVTDNFRVIMKWNKSVSFAAIIGYLADSVAHG
jgi:membrane-bound lytic murein transglycosylase B